MRSPTLATVSAAWMIAAPLVAPAPPEPSAAVNAAQPLLSISVNDGRTSVAPGDELTYKIKIRNLGTSEARELDISQSLPAGLKLVSADRGGAVKSGSVNWRLDLAAGQDSTLTTVAKVGETPSDLLRLATVACATAKDGKKPLVCATHSDLLPAGAADARSGWSLTRWLWYGGAAALLVVGLIVALLARRRSRRRGASRTVPASATSLPAYLPSTEQTLSGRSAPGQPTGPNAGRSTVDGRSGHS